MTLLVLMRVKSQCGNIQLPDGDIQLTKLCMAKVDTKISRKTGLMALGWWVSDDACADKKIIKLMYFLV